MQTKPGLKIRLFHSLGATGLGPVITAVIQLVSIPIFLRFWGPKLYGEWLILSAIPVYLGFTDFGFGGVAANEMTMLVAKGEKEAALEVFQSAWLLTTAVSVSVGLCVVLSLWVFPIERWLHLALFSRGEMIAILSILCLSVLFDLQWNVIAAGFRCDGNYALGTLLGNVVRLLVNGFSVAAVVFHASPLVVAIIFTSLRFLGNKTGQMFLARRSAWLHYGYRNAHLGVIRKLWVPAIAYTALAAGNAFVQQGMTIVIAMAVGPVAVVVFSTTRTLTRFVFQIAATINNAIWAEMSTAFGAGKKLLARNLHRCACQASMALSLAGVLFLALFGTKIYGYWTHHRVVMDQVLFHLLLVEVLANAFWYTSSVVPIACNRHQRQGTAYAVSTAASLPAAYFLMLWLGLPGAGIALILMDFCMIAYVLPDSLALLEDAPLSFLGSLFRAPKLGEGRPEAQGVGLAR